MAPATVGSSVGGDEIAATAALLRDEDLLSHALRRGNFIDVDDIARFIRAIPPSAGGRDLLTITGSSSQSMCSSHEDSTATKPTSATSYPLVAHKDKGKHRMKAGYASSLSVTYGSASEAEVELAALRRNSLIALGEWVNPELKTTAALKGKVRARDRRHTRPRSKQKKPIVVIEYGRIPAANKSSSPTPEHRVLTLPSVPSYGSIDLGDAHTGSTSNGNDASSSVEEGQPGLNASHASVYQPLTPSRKHTIVALIVLKVFIVALAAYGAYMTGNKRLPCTKGILFAATSSMAILTVSTILLARYALVEALLAGLIEFVFGFAIVVEIDDFM